MEKSSKHIIYFFSLILLLVACNNSDMQLSYQHTIQIGIYSKHTLKDTTLNEVKIYGIGREDSLLYDEATIGSLFLNLNMNRCTTQFVFKTQTLQDELFFTYQKHLEPVSGSGGIAMQIHIDSIGHTQTFIDSVSIINAEIKYNESLENVKIFVY